MLFFLLSFIFYQRHYASAVYMPRSCVCLCLSITTRNSIKTAEWIELGFWHRSFLQPVLCYKEIPVSPKIKGVLKFHHGKSITLSTKLIHGQSRGPHLWWSTRGCWTHRVYYTLVDCNLLTLLLWFLLDSLYKLFVQLCSTWQDFDWHSASHSPSAAAELLVTFSLPPPHTSSPRLKISPQSLSELLRRVPRLGFLKQCKWTSTVILGTLKIHGILAAFWRCYFQWYQEASFQPIKS